MKSPGKLESRIRARTASTKAPPGWSITGYELPDYEADDWFLGVLDNPEFWHEVDKAPTWAGACCLTVTDPDSGAAQLDVEAGGEDGGATIAVSSIRELVGTMLQGIVDEKAGPGITFGTFSGVRRRNADFEKARWVSLDIDAGTDGQPTPELTKLTDALPGVALLVYPTFSHGRVKGEQPAMGRYRVCIFFKQAVRTPEEFRRLHQHLGELLARHGFALDGSTKDAARHSYLPRWNPEKLAPEYRDHQMWEPEPGWLAFHSGALLDLEALPGVDGDAVPLKVLMEADEKKAEEVKAAAKKAAAEQQPGTPGGMQLRLPARRRARFILERKLSELPFGGTGDLGRNSSVHHLGAEVERLRHYVGDTYADACEQRVIDAAIAAGLTDRKELVRQYRNGQSQGRKDGPKYLRDRAKSASYARFI